MRSASVLFALLCFVTAGLHAQSSASFAIEADVFDAGGLGNASPKSASFAAISVIGQAAARASSTSASFDVSSGVICLFCGKAGPVGVDHPPRANSLYLGAAYPNPANAASGSSILIPYGVSEAASVRLRLYDVYGRVVGTLHDGEQVEGRHFATLDASELSQGTYIIVLEAPGNALTGILTVLR